MPLSPQYLTSRINYALKRIGGMDRKVYLRTYTQTPGTDALTGRDAGTFTDTLIDPQPAYNQLSNRDIVFLGSMGKRVTANDYKIVLSGSSVSDDTLSDPTTQFVLKDTGGEEVLRIIDIDSKGVQGQTVARFVIGRSVNSSG